MDHGLRRRSAFAGSMRNPVSVSCTPYAGGSGRITRPVGWTSDGPSTMGTSKLCPASVPDCSAKCRLTAAPRARSAAITPEMKARLRIRETDRWIAHHDTPRTQTYPSQLNERRQSMRVTWSTCPEREYCRQANFPNGRQRDQG